MSNPAPSRTLRSKRPPPRADSAQDSSTISWDWTRRLGAAPSKTSPTEMLIGAYRTLSSTAARIAAAAVPPASRIDAAANWAEPAKVVADMTIGASQPIPTLRASKPKETANGKTAIPIGTARRTPSRSRVVIALHHRHLPLRGEGGVAPRQRGGGALRPQRLHLDPLLRLRKEDAHLGEERSRRRSSRLEPVDALEPGEYGASLVHALDGTGANRSCWCRFRAERTASAGGCAGGDDGGTGATDRPARPRTETEQRLVETGDEARPVLVEDGL